MQHGKAGAGVADELDDPELAALLETHQEALRTTLARAATIPNLHELQHLEARLLKMWRHRAVRAALDTFWAVAVRTLHSDSAHGHAQRTLPPPFYSRLARSMQRALVLQRASAGEAANACGTDVASDTAATDAATDAIQTCGRGGPIVRGPIGRGRFLESLIELASVHVLQAEPLEHAACARA